MPVVPGYRCPDAQMLSETSMNKFRSQAICGLAFTCLLLGSHWAEGGIIIVTDRAAWVNILDSGQVDAVDTFTGSSAYLDSSANPTVSRNATGPTPVSYEVKNTSRTAIFNNALSSASAVGSNFTFANFSPGVNAIGFNSWLGNSSGNPVTPTEGQTFGPIVIYVNGTLEMEANTSATSSTDFFGIYDDTGATISELRVEWFRENTTVTKFQYMDNLEFGVAAGGGGGGAVPEPSTAITMCLIGVVGFAGIRRRRRSATV